MHDNTAGILLMGIKVYGLKTYSPLMTYILIALKILI